MAHSPPSLRHRGARSRCRSAAMISRGRRLRLSLATPGRPSPSRAPIGAGDRGSGGATAVIRHARRRTAAATRSTRSLRRQADCDLARNPDDPRPATSRPSIGRPLCPPRRAAAPSEEMLTRFSQLGGATAVDRRGRLPSERSTGHRIRRPSSTCCSGAARVADGCRRRPLLDLDVRQCRAVLVRDCRPGRSDARAHVPPTGIRPPGRRRWHDGVTRTSSVDHVHVRHVRLTRASGPTASASRPRAVSAAGVMAVVNRQLGIGTYSPRLDRYGNSCRGIAACEAMASRLGLHVFDCLNVGSSYLTRSSCSSRRTQAGADALRYRC